MSVPTNLRCARCSRPCPFDEWVTGEGVHESGWLSSDAIDADGYPQMLVCPGCATVDEDSAATAEMLRIVGDDARPEEVDAEIDRVAARQRWTREASGADDA